MPTADFETFLEDQRLGIARASQDGRILSHNAYFPPFAQSNGPLVARPLAEVLPETIGLEPILNQIATNKRKRFVLEELVREKDGHPPIFFTLYFYPSHNPDAPLLLILRDVTDETLRRQQILQQKNELRLLENILESRGDFIRGSLLGDSPPIQTIRETIAKVSLVPFTTILLQGESGTGKNLVARIIHYSSHKEKAPFVEINCAAIPETLLESELFGFEKGAFTNADTGKTGLLEEANGGTLFLDEISEMSLNLQAKLLSFLETRRFRRLGSTREIEVKLRLIAATNQNLRQLVREKRFREDLFYRLNVVWINLPPLRNLGEDIFKIAQNFIDLFNIDFNKHIRGLTDDARQALLSYSWPGNVRELRNVIERAMIFAEGDFLTAEDFLFPERENPADSPDKDVFHIPPEGLPWEEAEKKLLLKALEMSRGNQSQAARLLHLSRDTLRYRLKKHGLL